MLKLLKHGQSLMSQKASIILGFKDEIRRTTEHFNKVTEMQTIGKREAEIAYKERLYALQEEWEVKRKNVTEQYDHLLRIKEEELTKFKNDAQKYIGEKKTEMRGAKTEIVQLYDIVQRQKQTIDQVEEGKYDGGIKSFSISKDDKQHQPRREEFPFLYKSLEKSKKIVT